MDSVTPLGRPRRVAVVGNTASGKSFLAGRIGQGLGLPVVHLDKVYWQPGWKHISRDEFLIRHQELIAEPAWVIDGCFAEFGLDERFQLADAVMFLDIPTRICLRRTISRRGNGRDDLPTGADDAALPPIRAMGFLAEIALFNVMDKPRILRAVQRADPRPRFFRLCNWAAEDDAVSALSGATPTG